MITRFVSIVKKIFRVKRLSPLSHGDKSFLPLAEKTYVHKLELGLFSMDISLFYFFLHFFIKQKKAVLMIICGHESF